MKFTYSENYLENGEMLANKERKGLFFGKLFLQYIIVKNLTHILGICHYALLYMSY